MSYINILKSKKYNALSSTIMEDKILMEVLQHSSHGHERVIYGVQKVLNFQY